MIIPFYCLQLRSILIKIVHSSLPLALNCFWNVENRMFQENKGHSRKNVEFRLQARWLTSGIENKWEHRFSSWIVQVLPLLFTGCEILGKLTSLCLCFLIYNMGIIRSHRVLQQLQGSANGKHSDVKYS